jgi:CDP-diacylglycerol---glycerol-3-phosphate 3-phosphatidyltransferase
VDFLPAKETTSTQPDTTLSGRVRHHLRGVTSAAGQTGVRLGINPDAVTIAGLVIVAIASVFIAQGQFLIGAIILILGMPLDAWDGAIARARGKTTRFGGFLDSTLDRFADGFLLLGLMVWFSGRGQQTELIITGLALIGAFGVSYTRAKAESLDIDCKEGLFSRMERTVVQIGMLITGWVVVGVIVLAIGNNFTALQRMWVVYRATRED